MTDNKIYYFIYILNGISYKEGAFDKEFITSRRNELAEQYNVAPETMPIFEE